MGARVTDRRVEIEDEPPAGLIRWLISCDESGIGGSPYYGFGTLWMSPKALAKLRRPSRS